MEKLSKKIWLRPVCIKPPPMGGLIFLLKGRLDLSTLDIKSFSKSVNKILSFKQKNKLEFDYI